MIDPSLSIPSSVLPPLPEGVSEDARENLLLKTKDGKIEADVTIVPCSVPDSVDDKGKRKKVVLYAKTSDGKVALKLVCSALRLKVFLLKLTFCMMLARCLHPFHSSPPYQLNNHHLRRKHPPQPPSFLPWAVTPQNQGRQSPFLRGGASAGHHVPRR